MTWFKLCTAVTVLCFVLPGATAVQADETRDPVAAIVAQADALRSINELHRMADELVFWQSVALMGGAFNWEFAYSSGGKDMQKWTLRLQNFIGDADIEAKRTAQAIARNRGLTDEEKQRGAELYARYTDLVEVATQMYDLLIADEVGAAADLYETRTIEMRRDFARAALSGAAGHTDNIKKLALQARLR